MIATRGTAPPKNITAANSAWSSLAPQVVRDGDISRYSTSRYVATVHGAPARPGVGDNFPSGAIHGNLGSMKRALILLVATGCIGRYVRKTTGEKIEATAERLQRGKYLVDGPAACGACHTTWNNGTYLDGESDEYLAGGNYIEVKSQGYGVWVPNITPDPKTGIGNWSDDQIMRAIRDGVNADGHLLLPFMPFSSYQHMSDEDVRAIVAYLRSIPPREQKRPRRANQVPAGM